MADKRRSTFRNSITDTRIGYDGKQEGMFRKVSTGAKRFSQSFIGLISKAYGDKSPEPDYNAVDYFSNPLKIHISEEVSSLRNPINQEELLHAIRALGHIAVAGGNEASGYVGKFILPDLAAKLRNPIETYEVKLAVIEAVSEMTAFCMKDNQDLCREYGIILFLLESLEAHSNTKELLMRQWAAHALFYCIVDHVDNKRYVLNYNIWFNLKHLCNFMHPDDTMWEFNDAEMLLDMLRK